MKHIIIVILSIALAIGCTSKKLTNKETAISYFNARNSTDFTKVRDLIYDSLTVIDGDYIMPYSRDSYYEVFKWDSVFQTSYEIIEIQEIGEDIIASIALSSIRNRFLENDSMTCDFKLSFDSGKITKIRSQECKNANWQNWEKRVIALVEWIGVNHPELNGFIHDMTMTGANNYLKAIELYNSNNNGSIKLK